MKSILAAALVVVSMQAHAVFVTADHPGFGPKWTVTDTQSGLTWLNLNITQWWVPSADIAERLGRQAPMFRFATQGEIDGLMSHVDASFADAFIGHQPYLDLQFSGANDHVWFHGYLPTPSDGCSSTITGPRFYRGELQDIQTICGPFSGGGYDFFAPSAWVVASHAPEPSTWALMLAGLYLCLHRARAARQSWPSKSAVQTSRTTLHI